MRGKVGEPLCKLSRIVMVDGAFGGFTTLLASYTSAEGLPTTERY